MPGGVPMTAINQSARVSGRLVGRVDGCFFFTVVVGWIGGRVGGWGGGRVGGRVGGRAVNTGPGRVGHA